MSQNLTKVGIVGASGYTGEELVRVLARHPRVKLAAVCSRTLAGKSVADEIPRLRGIVAPALVFSASSPEECAKSDVDVWFLALPHGVAAEYAAPLVAGRLALRYPAPATDRIGPAVAGLTVTTIGNAGVLYVATGLDISFRMRFTVVRTVAVLLAGTIPFASFFADHYVTRSVRAKLDATA